MFLAAVDYMHGGVFCKLSTLMQSLYPRSFIAGRLVWGCAAAAPPRHPSLGTDANRAAEEEHDTWLE